MGTARREWAEEKVRLLYDDKSKEKGTLKSIAHYADPDGTNAYCRVASIAKDAGRSIRTVQTHLRALNSRCQWPQISFADPRQDNQQNADVRIAYQAAEYRKNLYEIPLCLTEIASRNGSKAESEERSKQTVELILKNSSKSKRKTEHDEDREQIQRTAETEALFQAAMAVDMRIPEHGRSSRLQKDSAIIQRDHAIISSERKVP